MTRAARAARLLTALAALGLFFMGAVIAPVYLVPALTVVLVLGLAAEARPRLRTARAAPPGPAAAPVGSVTLPALAAADACHDAQPR